MARAEGSPTSPLLTPTPLIKSSVRSALLVLLVFNIKTFLYHSFFFHYFLYCHFCIYFFSFFCLFSYIIFHLLPLYSPHYKSIISIYIYQLIYPSLAVQKFHTIDSRKCEAKPAFHKMPKPGYQESQQSFNPNYNDFQVGGVFVVLSGVVVYL